MESSCQLFDRTSQRLPVTESFLPPCCEDTESAQRRRWQSRNVGRIYEQSCPSLRLICNSLLSAIQFSVTTIVHSGLSHICLKLEPKHSPRALIWHHLKWTCYGRFYGVHQKSKQERNMKTVLPVVLHVQYYRIRHVLRVCPEHGVRQHATTGTFYYDIS